MKIYKIIYRMRTIDMYQAFGRIIDPLYLTVGRINKDGHIYMIGKSLEILQFAFLLCRLLR